MRKIFLLLFATVTVLNLSVAQTTNKGTEFWVGYGHHQFMETTTDNSQNMTLYFSVDDLPVGVNYATVTVTLDSSGLNPSLNWKRVYHISANTVISIDNSATPAFSYSPSTALSWGPLPKGPTGATASNTSPNFDARLFSNPIPTGTSSEGLFRKKGIHIESDYPIIAYSHIYGSVSSGASMLIPVSNWGNKYTTINSRQADAAGAFNFFYVIANNDSTPIKIIPSQNSRLGKLAKMPIYVTLQKGHIYQYVGYADATGNGVQLTSSIVESLDPSKPIAVFAGSSRTSGENTTGCIATSRDNDMQQCFPEETWGLKYITTPFSKASGSSITPSVLAGSSYKIVARDSGTIIYINNNTPIQLATGSFYQFTNATPNVIKANKPIAVAQFMTSSNCSTGDGDPEMIYLSPIERGVKQAGFYRHTKESITTNYVALVVPNDGLNSLTVDGQPYPQFGGGNYYYNKHPNDTSYTIFIKGWAASKSQCIIKCDKRFTGITYGLGGAESYGYNVGANFYLSTPNINPDPKVTVKGVLYCDDNNNGQYDSSETLMTNVKVQMGFGSNYYTITNNNGEYEISFDSISAGAYTFLFMSGTDTITRTFVLPSSLSDTTIYQNISLCSSGGAINSLSIDVFPFYANAIAGQPYPYYVLYNNLGTSNLSPVVTLKYSDNLLMYDSCNDPLVIPTVNGLSKAINNFSSGNTESFSSYFTVNPAANNGDTLRTVFSINDITTGAGQKDSFYVLVQNNYSPITQSARPAISPAQIASGKGIDYSISFRNTGTFTVNSVRITDTLSALLNANSIEVIAASHPYKATIKGNNILFEMLNINLVDSTKNKFKSIGFIKFRVKPKSGVVIGDIITNKASVYFDFENVINTNIVSTVVNATGVITPLKITDYYLKLTNENQVVNLWSTANEINVSHFSIQRSFNKKDFITIGEVAAKNKTNNSYSYTDNLSGNNVPLVIYYRLMSTDKDSKISYSEIRQVTLKNDKVNSIRLYPNPTNSTVNISINSSTGIKEIIVVDYLGKTVLTQLGNALSNSNQSYDINIQQLKAGIYIVKVLLNNGETRIEKLIKE